MSSSTRVTNFFASTDMTESKVMPPNRTRQCLLWVIMLPPSGRTRVTELAETSHLATDYEPGDIAKTRHPRITQKT